MPLLRPRTSFFTCPSPIARSQALSEVDEALSLSTPTWCSSRPRHLRVLCKNEAESELHSAPINFYIFEKVSARAQPTPAAPHIPRSLHLTCAVPFVQASVALGSLKLRNPMEPRRERWLYPCVRVVLRVFPPPPVALRA